jgi:hypothetical protein
MTSYIKAHLISTTLRESSHISCSVQAHVAGHCSVPSSQQRTGVQLAHEVSVYNTPSGPHAASTDTPNYCESIAFLVDYNKPEIVGNPIDEYRTKTTSTSFIRCIQDAV